jgi:hypothetical protein
MATLDKELKNDFSSITNVENKKEDLIPSSVKFNDEISKNNNSKYKKVILPSLQAYKGLSFSQSNLPYNNRKLRSSQSQEYFISNNNNDMTTKTSTNNNNYNLVKERLMFAKMTLSRLKAKINEINNSYKKLLAEKEENLNILRQAISSNDYSYSEQIYKKIEKMLDDAVNAKENNNSKNYDNSTDQKNAESNNIKIDANEKQQLDKKNDITNINNINNDNNDNNEINKKDESKVKDNNEIEKKRGK